MVDQILKYNFYLQYLKIYLSNFEAPQNYTLLRMSNIGIID